MTIDPKLKPWIIGGAAVVGLAVLFVMLRGKGSKDQNQGNGGSDGNGGGQAGPQPSKCKAPEVPCVNNPDLCFDPNINYLVDPCSSGGESEYKQSGEPSFMPEK